MRGGAPSARDVTNCSLLSLAVGRAPSGGRGRSPRSRAGPWTCVDREPQPLLSSCRPRPAQRARPPWLFGVRPEDTGGACSRRAPGLVLGRAPGLVLGRGGAGRGSPPWPARWPLLTGPAAQPARAGVQRTTRRGKREMQFPLGVGCPVFSKWIYLVCDGATRQFQVTPGALGSGRAAPSDPTVGPTDTVEFRNWECVELRKIHGKGS